jgi:hypothetical protein
MLLCLSNTGITPIIWHPASSLTLMILPVVADYLIIPIIGCILSSSNLVGYFKCSREAGDQFKAMTSNLMQQAATRAVTQAVASRV